MEQWRASRWVGLAAGLLWLGLAAFFTARFAGRTWDDFFITYRYAQNVAHGEGLVFNPGERVFGTTAPGFALLLALLHRATRIPIPILGTLSTAAALLSLAGLAWRDGRASGRWPEALVIGTLLVSCTFVWLQNGSEVPVVMAFLAGAMVLLTQRPIAAGLIAGLAVTFRPDALLGVAILGLLAWRAQRRLPRAYVAAAAAVIALAALGAWAWFGTVLPNTLAAKSTQRGA